MDGLQQIVNKLVATGLDKSELWVDGSFVTAKLEPDDADIVLIAPSHFFDNGTKEQQEILDWLEDRQERESIKRDYHCHTFSVLDYPATSQLHVLTAARIRGFQEDFGYSVLTHEPKGIAVIAIAQPKIEEQIKKEPKKVGA